MATSVYNTGGAITRDYMMSPYSYQTDSVFISVSNMLKSKNCNWNDEQIKLLIDTYSNHKVSISTVIRLIESESTFNHLAKNKYSSATGLLQVINSTARLILGDEIALEYSNNTRSLEDQIIDSRLILDHHIKNIKDGDYSFGRIKIGLLSPYHNINRIIPEVVWDNSLSNKAKLVLSKNESTYKDLIKFYNNGNIN